MLGGPSKSSISKKFLKLIGKRHIDLDSVSEEEIKNLVNEQDSLLDEEKRMIGEIFELGDTKAREIMIPRVDMVLAEDSMTVRQTIDRMRGTGFSRLPVFHDDHDTIVGIVMVKDLITPLLDDSQDEPISKHMREAVFVPETKDILPLLTEMQNERQQLVVVVDEYGGTAGLISVEDIIEEIVGEIVDEYDLERKYITEVGDGEWIVDGRLTVDDAIENGLPIEASDDYDTIAGWLMSVIDFVPTVGEQFQIGNMQIIVRAMRRRRISTLKIILSKTSKYPASFANGKIVLLDMRARKGAVDFKLQINSEFCYLSAGVFDAVCADRPTLLEHACTDDAGDLDNLPHDEQVSQGNDRPSDNPDSVSSKHEDSAQEEPQTLPHLIEHLAIDFLVQHQRECGQNQVFAGYSAWLNKKNGIARITLSTNAQAVTQTAMFEACEFAAKYLD